MNDPNYFSSVAHSMSENWKNDWGKFFGQIQEETGLSIQEVLLYHLVNSNVTTQNILGRVYGYPAPPPPPKEPWEEL